ncbi:MAG TPA: nitrous oxide reductase family maturation protein NosD [Gammaproteobacteria bacterium]|nr:nitrous oxide reductase family maturation protein NosD [Gammaproteobacteria bacterium]
MKLFTNCFAGRPGWVIQHLLLPAMITLLTIPALANPPLQLYVALTPTGGTLTPPAGIYSGPVTIDRQMTIDGKGKVTIDGDGEGTVVTINADGVQFRGIKIINSGDSHDRIDAALLITANKTTVEENTIENSLFGIHLRKADNNVIRHNRVSSKDYDSSMRGEGLRLWYSFDNEINGNTFKKVRDIVVANSSDNRFLNNHISNSRIGMEFIFSPDNEISGNTIENNDTGITVLYSGYLQIDHNQINHMRILTGSGLAFKESSQVVIEDNRIAHCAVGLRANAPIHPENILYARRNTLLFNDIAMFFYGEKGGHVIHNNAFLNNFVDVLGSASMTVRDNDWRGNYWDKYAGYDFNHDGVGDQPYEIYLYSDRIWVDRPITRFFRGSPALSLVDFVERLAPFSAPELVLRDPEPRMQKPAESRFSSNPDGSPD